MSDFVSLISAVKDLEFQMILIIFLAGGIYLFRKTFGKALDRLLSPNKNNVQKGVQKDRVIDDALNMLLYETAADIAYIVTFHNGIKYYTGEHKNRMSRDYEVVGAGIAPQALSYQDIPVSLYTTTLEEIMANRYRYDHIEDIPDIRTRLALKERGVEATSCAPYYDKNGNLIALIGIEYISRKPDVETILSRRGLTEWDSDKLWEYFLKETNKIGGLLV